MPFQEVLVLMLYIDLDLGEDPALLEAGTTLALDCCLETPSAGVSSSEAHVRRWQSWL